MAELIARSALGARRGETPKAIFEAATLRIVEEPFLHVVSLRTPRARPDTAAVVALLSRCGVAAPSAPNALSGSAECGAAWTEPFAWLLVSAQPLPALAAADGVLATEISDRLAVFRISGAAAREVIAAGCDPQILRPLSCARTRFGGFCTAQLQHWQDGGIRVLVDVSLGATVADWLRQTGAVAGATIAR